MMLGKEIIEAAGDLYLKEDYEPNDAGVARKLAKQLRELGKSLDQADERRGLLLVMADEVDTFKVILLKGHGELKAEAFKTAAIRYSEIEIERLEAAAERLRREF